MANTTASASGTKRNFATPVRKNMGTNTMQIAKRRHQRGHGDLLRAVENRAHRLLALRQVAVDVFDFHCGVVHQDAHGQRQAAERHDVDGFAQRAQHEDRDQHGKRNGNGNDQGAAPVSQEQQDHQRRSSTRRSVLRESRPESPRARRSIDRTAASSPVAAAGQAAICGSLA